MCLISIGHINLIFIRTQEELTMYCKKCGNQIDEGAAFCKKCGAPVENIPNITAAGMGKGVMQVNAQYLRIGITAASLLMALATALPYLVLKDELARYTGMRSISLINAGGKAGDGILFILFAVLMLVFLYLKKNIPVLVCGIVPLLMYCFELSQIKKQAAQLLGSGIDMYDYMSKGFGFYLLSFSVIGLLVLSVLFYMQNRNAEKRNECRNLK